MKPLGLEHTTVVPKKVGALIASSEPLRLAIARA